MKIKSSDLKEMIRQAISEMTEGGKGSGRPTKPGSAKDIEKRAMSAADAANAKMDAAEKAAKAKKKVKEGGPGSGPHGDDEDNPFDKEPSDDDLRDIEKQFEGASPKTIVRRHTVKEVRMWMKKLEENRYKKVYNSDARRVAWMVNNEGVKLTEMPISMRKKWTKAEYGRERYLAKEFLNSQKSKLKEQKLRETIRNIIKRLI